MGQYPVHDMESFFDRKKWLMYKNMKKPMNSSLLYQTYTPTVILNHETLN